MADILSELMGWKGTPLTGDIDRDLQSQIDFYQQQGNIKAANQFREIQNEKNSMFWGFRDNLLNYYDTFEQITNPSFQEFVNQSNQQAARVIPEIQEQGKFVREKFWPNGEIAGKANAYFQDLIKTVNQSVSWQVATAANMNQRQGGSRAWLNASIQEARAQWLPLLSQIRWEERAEQERLYNNYMQLLSWLRNERIAVENENIKKPLLMLQERANALGTNIVNGLREMDWLDVNEIVQNNQSNRNLNDQFALMQYQYNLENQWLGWNNTTQQNQVTMRESLPIRMTRPDWSLAPIQVWSDWQYYIQWDSWFTKLDQAAVNKSLQDQWYQVPIRAPQNINILDNAVITSYWWTHDNKTWLDYVLSWWANAPVPSPVTWEVVAVNNTFKPWQRINTPSYWNYIAIRDSNWNMHQLSHLNWVNVKPWDVISKWQLIWLQWNTWYTLWPTWVHVDHIIKDANWNLLNSKLVEELLRT